MSQEPCNGRRGARSAARTQRVLSFGAQLLQVFWMLVTGASNAYSEGSEKQMKT